MLCVFRVSCVFCVCVCLHRRLGSRDAVGSCKVVDVPKAACFRCRADNASSERRERCCCSLAALPPPPPLPRRCVRGQEALTKGFKPCAGGPGSAAEAQLPAESNGVKRRQPRYLAPPRPHAYLVSQAIPFASGTSTLALAIVRSPHAHTRIVLPPS